ncbi:MAG: TonB-dependent receptor, partial [Chitinophagaceae bacterium]
MRILTILTGIFLIPMLGIAQVTSSNITGVVKDATGNPLEGASITAVHKPSGTTYGTTSRKQGVFTIPNARIGGPYSIKIEYVGYDAITYDNINLLLGEPFYIDAVMGEKATTLSEVTITARKRRISADKTGASTNISARQLATLPTISRSITDFTRLTPQSNGTSFAGRDGRFNNIQVDGANLNNNFGLSTDPLPGGGNNPISLDAYEEISVNLAPYDVRQGAFTGAGINAVTKSGTNTFKGTAYSYVRNQNYNGRNVGDNKLSAPALQNNQTFGFTFGGPIVKNKLFFFTSAEYELREYPGITYTPKGGSGEGNVSAVSIDSLKKFSELLQSKYGYETGPYDNFPNFKAENYKFLAKLDWNISKVHKLTVKYNELNSSNDVQLNASSIPNGGGFTPVGGSSTTRLPNSRFGLASMSFTNSNYGFNDVVRSAALELNSNFGGSFSNQFLATVTKIRSTRTSPSAVFPAIDIMNNNGQNYMFAGYEPYSYNNDVINDVASIINNANWYRGNHHITAGASYEYQRVGNMFMAGSQSYYVFNSLQDFADNKAPAYFAYTYSLVPGKPAVYSAELKIGQIGAYLQDEWTVNNKFKVVYGIRADKAIYLESPLENAAVKALNLPDANGKMTNYSTGLWPKSRLLLSPRIGFRWDVDGDKSLVIRGGTGIFTGRIPFVWLTNMPTNSGMYQYGASVTKTADLANYTFNKDPDYYKSKFPTTAGTSVPPNIVLMDPNFKFPQIFRTNFAFDKQLGQGWSLTMEAIITKDINAVKMRNANEKPTNALFSGTDTRPRFLNSADRKYYSGVTSAIVLENTNKGGGFSFTTQLNKNFSKGLNGFVAYSYTFYNEVTANPGSQASSVWNSNATIGTQNSLELYNGQNVLPHRIIGAITWRKEYLKHLGTTISLFYEGASQGRISYIYNGDMNNDGNNATDLLYVPKSPSDIVFVAATAGSTTAAYTAQQQSEAFFKFVKNTPYLAKNMGKYTSRNGAVFPWYNRL